MRKGERGSEQLTNCTSECVMTVCTMPPCLVSATLPSSYAVRRASVMLRLPAVYAARRGRCVGLVLGGGVMGWRRSRDRGIEGAPDSGASYTR